MKAVLIKTNDDLDNFHKMIGAFSRFVPQWTDEKQRELDLGSATAVEAEGGILVTSHHGDLEPDLLEVIEERYVAFWSRGVHHA